MAFIPDPQQTTDQSLAPGSTLLSGIEGIGKQLGAGGLEGVAGAVGFPGMLQQGMDWAAQKAGYLPQGESNRLLPSPGEVSNAIQGVTGQFPAPQGLGEETARTVGQFGINAIGPGGPVKAALRVLVPSLFSEAAGQTARKVWPALEPYARAAGGLYGSIKTAVKMGGELPATSVLEDTKRAIYQDIDSRGGFVTPLGLQNIVGDVNKEARSLGINARLHPDAMRALAAANDALKQYPNGMPLEKLDQLRQSIRDVARNRSGQIKNTQDRELRVLYGMLDRFDTSFDTLGQNPKLFSVRQGDPAMIAPLFGAAREANKMWRRAQTLDDMVESATVRSGQSANPRIENALRTEFRQLQWRMIRNKALRGTYSDAEYNTIAKAANPGWLENKVRDVGKTLSPRNPGFGVLTGLLAGHGITELATNPKAGAIPLALSAAGMGVGMGATNLSRALTERNVGNAKRAVFGAPPIPLASPSPFAVPGLLAPLTFPPFQQ